MRKDAINALRTFKVTLPGAATPEYVMAHRHALGTDAVLLFMSDTMDGSYVRFMFRHWLKVEEIVKIDGSESGRIDN